MKKAGGIIALIAGIFGIIMAFITLMIGGIGGAFQADGADTVANLGWGGVVFSFIVIIFGAIGIGANSRIIGILLMIASITGAILGGTLVAIFMVLSFIGGLLVTIGVKKPKKDDKAELKTEPQTETT